MGIFTSLRRCWLGVENLEKLVFIYINWPNDAKLDYKMVERFISDFFATYDALLDDNE
jgi:hypothetical protein